MKLNVIRSDDSIMHVALIGRLDVPGVNEIQYELFHQVISLPKSTLVDLSKLTYLHDLIPIANEETAALAALR